MKTPEKAEGSPTEAEIQRQAYLLWLEGGCRPGRELDDWLAARELLQRRQREQLMLLARRLGQLLEGA